MLRTPNGTAEAPGRRGRAPLGGRGELSTGQGTGPGLDEHQVRTWCPWHRWSLFAILAYALLAVCAAIEARQGPAEGGLITLTCNEIAHLLNALFVGPLFPSTCWAGRCSDAPTKPTHASATTAGQPRTMTNRIYSWSTDPNPWKPTKGFSVSGLGRKKIPGHRGFSPHHLDPVWAPVRCAPIHSEGD